MKFFQTKDAIELEITPLKQPKYGDAGYDLRSVFEIDIPVNSQVKIHTGLHLAIPNGFVGIVKDRSSMALQQVYVNSGIIDSSYRGEVLVILENRGTEKYSILPNQKIAQILIVPHYFEPVTLVNNIELLGNTERGKKGFGSTGNV